MKAHPDTRNVHEIRKTKGVSWGNLHCLGKSLGSLAQKAHGGERRTSGQTHTQWSAVQVQKPNHRDFIRSKHEENRLLLPVRPFHH